MKRVQFCCSCTTVRATNFALFFARLLKTFVLAVARVTILRAGISLLAVYTLPSMLCRMRESVAHSIKGFAPQFGLIGRDPTTDTESLRGGKPTRPSVANQWQRQQLRRRLQVGMPATSPVKVGFPRGRLNLACHLEYQSALPARFFPCRLNACS